MYFILYILPTYLNTISIKEQTLIHWLRYFAKIEGFYTKFFKNSTLFKVVYPNNDKNKRKKKIYPNSQVLTH